MFQVFIVSTASDLSGLNAALAAGANVEAQHCLGDRVYVLIWIPPAPAA